MLQETQELVQDRGKRWIKFALPLIVVIGIVVVAFVASKGMPSVPAPAIEAPEFAAPEITAPSLPLDVETPANLALNLNVGILTLGLLGLFVFSLLECEAQGDFLMLDFFCSWGLLLLLVLGQIYGFTDKQWFAGLVGAGLLGMVIATFWNPTSEGEPAWYNRVDTTHWYVLGLALIFVRYMASPAVPYPAYIPFVVPILVTIAAAGKEFFRQVQFSLMAAAVGFVAALLQGAWLAVGLAVVLLIAIWGNRQGWTTSRGTSHNMAIGGRTLKVFVAWDLVLFYIGEVVLIGYALWGNYAVITFVK